MKMRVRKIQLIKLIVICIIINGFFISFTINSSFENRGEKIEENFEIGNSFALNTRAKPKIIDLNKETNFPHHNVTIYGSGHVMISGDVNGDNIDDILVSHERFDGPNGNRTDCGAVFIKYGNTTQSPINYLTSDYDLIIHGTEGYDRIGSSLAVGDVNHDGYNDILIGSISASGDLNGKSMCGEVYIIHGDGSLPKTWDLKTTPANTTIYGVDAFDRLGGSLATGDINNDSIDDIIIGATYGKGPNNSRSWSTMGCGEVYVIFGNDSLSSIIDLTNKADLCIYGAEARDSFGYAIATCDINSDNITDLIISAYGASGYKNLKGFGGEVYVFYGTDKFPASIDLLTIPANMTIYCEDGGDRLGFKITCGDLNGDTIDDIVICAVDSRGANNSKPYCGEVWLIFGNKTNTPVINSSDVDAIIYGIDGNDSMGWGISIGTLNNDKYDDLIIGAYNGDRGSPGQNRENCGEAYVIYGKPNWSKKIEFQYIDPDIIIYGADGKTGIYYVGDWAGRDVLISDINGDNLDDILINSPNAEGRNNDGQTTGEIAIILSGGEVLPIPVIESIKFLNGAGEDKKTSYARYSMPYIFQLLITTPNKLEDLDTVTLSLAYKFSSMNYQLTWTRSTGEFMEIYDPEDHLEISDQSTYKNDGNHTWTIKFYLIFDMMFPDNFYHTIRLHSTFNSVYQDWLNLTKDIFRVENRFDLTGNLTVTTKYLGQVSNGDWVRGNETLTWSGLKVVYYETDDVYPPSDIELYINVWDSQGNNWSWRNLQNEFIIIETITINKTMKEETYQINISNLPWWLDQSYIKFNLNIDNDPVVYSNSFPASEVWHSTLRPLCGIQITDPSSNVDINLIQYRISLDNGNNWNNWSGLGVQYEYYYQSINCTVRPIFNDGENNLIQWRSRDIVGNPFTESEIYQIRTDISNVTFTNPTPLPEEWQKNSTVICDITVSDQLSGVNASSIEYSTSTSGIWEFGDWQSARKSTNSNSIHCTITPTFIGGTDNYIRWRAKDVVGNGYRISDNYQIKVKINHPPTTTLITPQNNSLINNLIPELIWEGIDLDNDTKLNYKIYLSTEFDQVKSLNSTAIIKTIVNKTRYRLEVPLENKRTYYWTVIPNDFIINGTCTSGYNIFKLDTSVQLPLVTLLEPKDKSIITTKTPNLSWNLSYSNPNIVSYNIYFAKSSNQNLVSKENLYKKDYKIMTFEFEKSLIPGENYYWTIIPVAALPEGNLEGICISGIWSFKVELPEERIYRVELEIENQKLKISQGNYSSTNISVINKGNTADTIEVSYDTGILDANIGLENSNSPIWLDKDEIIRLKLEILVAEDAKPQNYTISITASSTGGLSEGKDISNASVTQILIVEVLEKAKVEDEKGKGEDKTSELSMTIWIFLIIVLILIIALFIYVYRSRRIPYVKSELLTKPPIHLKLPGASAKPGTDFALPTATDEEKAITLEGAAISATYQLPKAILTKDQELKLLRERLLLKEISEETYNKLRAEIESSEDITELEEFEPEDEEIGEEEPPLGEDLEKELEEEPIPSEIEVDEEEARAVEQFDKELGEEIAEEEPDNGEEEISEPLITKKKSKLKKKKKAKGPRLKEKRDEGPVEESVAEDELSDIPEEAYPFPEDGLCITCSQSLDPDMAYCWSCGTKYELKKK